MSKALYFLAGFFLASVVLVSSVITAGVRNIHFSDWLSVYGAILGAIITIVGAYIVFYFQEQAKDRRHLKTMLSVLRELHVAGTNMAGENGALDPATYVGDALLAYRTSESVGKQLRANGPNVAYVAERLEIAVAKNSLIRLQSTIEQGGGVAQPDLQARGNELAELATILTARLQTGL